MPYGFLVRRHIRKRLVLAGQRALTVGAESGLQLRCDTVSSRPRLERGAGIHCVQNVPTNLTLSAPTPTFTAALFLS